jgi:hypothetical protein
VREGREGKEREIKRMEKERKERKHCVLKGKAEEIHAALHLSM